MIHVEIVEISNGFTVCVFDSDGSAELDETVFVESFEDALEFVAEWRKEEKKEATK